jgi:hypothetical protein
MFHSECSLVYLLDRTQQCFLHDQLRSGSLLGGRFTEPPPAGPSRFTFQTR